MACSVRGLNGQANIALPGVFSRPSIPINHDHIPNTDMIDNWPHLEGLRNHLMPRSDCEVGLLIGYNCPRALVTKEVVGVPDNPDSPYGLRTELGWSIMGIISRSPEEASDLFGHSHRIVSTQITGSQIVPQGHSRKRSPKRAKKKPKKRRRAIKTLINSTEQKKKKQSQVQSLPVLFKSELKA